MIEKVTGLDRRGSRVPFCGGQREPAKLWLLLRHISPAGERTARYRMRGGSGASRGVRCGEKTEGAAPPSSQRHFDQRAELKLHLTLKIRVCWFQLCLRLWNGRRLVLTGPRAQRLAPFKGTESSEIDSSRIASWPFGY